MHAAPELERLANGWRGSFEAMASPCEVLLTSCKEATAADLLQQVADEAWRIETTFSRYRDDNRIHAINIADGAVVSVDEELAELLDYSATLFRISDGMFDITSGVLRRAWTFDGSDHVPDEQQIAALRPLVGWEKVTWKRPGLRMKPGMEIDLGGIGKEYAVDRCAGHLVGQVKGGLVNFGGDIRVIGPLDDGSAWNIGIEKVADADAVPAIRLSTGSVATSGDARRFVIREGRRYGHILDPKTGYPVKGAPRSVTVVDETCTQAGLLATLAMLQGVRAERFLAAQGVRHHVIR